MNYSELVIKSNRPEGGQFSVNLTDANYKYEPLWWQARGLSYTASGYGSKIPTEHKVKVGSRWYRVYCAIYSNSGTLFINRKNNRLTVDLY